MKNQKQNKNQNKNCNEELKKKKKIREIIGPKVVAPSKMRKVNDMLP